jgi:DNA-binding IclR family transcriptional regulator
LATETISRELRPPDGTPADGPLPSRALAKGLEILDIVAAASAPLSLGDVASATELGKPSALRLLQTLCSLDYLRKDDEGSYTVGPRMPGQYISHWTERLVVLASEELVQLNLDLAETVSLAALYDDHIRVVHTLESSHHIRMSNYLNRILPPYASSLGKAIAAFQPAEHIQQLIQVFGLYQITDRTLTDPVKIREHLAEVRENGFATEIEETVSGGCCFGAPIVEPDGRVRAAVSVSMPFARCSSRMKEQVPARVSEAAERIGKLLT